MKSDPGPPMTLGNAAAARVGLIVRCKDCHHQVEPDPAEMAARYGAETPVLDRRERLAGARIAADKIFPPFCSRWSLLWRAGRSVLSATAAGADRQNPNGYSKPLRLSERGSQPFTEYHSITQEQRRLCCLVYNRHVQIERFLCARPLQSHAHGRSTPHNLPIPAS
jgi:hypothetical protein